MNATHDVHMGCGLLAIIMSLLQAVTSCHTRQAVERRKSLATAKLLLLLLLPKMMVAFRLLLLLQHAAVAASTHQ
jgi:hypothetical protein